ncbi:MULTISPECIES: pyrroloquinoline quinone biosynthesis protein PqqF [unclassified Pseudomonas]|uniref:pyrroloquinoline quinone biosynthesis protein PqqF n=1 Tax=unclassified Pseudomonas TaxID=196821 RepID=UPI0035C1B9A3
MPNHTRQLILGNGLRLTLRHAPRLSRAAAALRVHAGSHDAPAQWPGLAHFLEHLFFLGTARFPLENGLMRYVQGLGGQVNASTRERTTDFFFEVPPTALAGGLERLCQMLVEPDLGLERQQREREVIHAEFIAWSRNPQARHQFALLQTVSARHPLSGFHAGNRYSLPLHAPDFQQALRQFHQGFYHGGQITLSLCGPQTLDELEALGRTHGSLFAAAQRRPQTAPVPLLDGPFQPLRISENALDLLFAHEHLPEGAQQAVELLLASLTDSRPGSWLGALRGRGELQACRAQLLYAFAGQSLWHIHLDLTANASAEHIQALLEGWLGFIQRTGTQHLEQAFAHLQRRREQAASALELARRDAAGQGFKPLDEAGRAALHALLASLPTREFGDWQLLPTETLLLAELPPAGTSPLPVGLATRTLLPSSRDCAAVHLRWQVRSALRERALPVLQQALRPLQERAERASVQLHLKAVGQDWELRCCGVAAAVVRTLQQALELLRTPRPEQWQAQPERPGVPMPLHALLKALPAALHAPVTPATSGDALDQPGLDALWSDARWHGLAMGFADNAYPALANALKDMMGQNAPAIAPPALVGRQWRQQPLPGSEQALLLFCPLPLTHQASGRLLAQLLQGRIYQRLRVELQLGYGVFSAYRQVEGFAGLLFGVQSPHASHGEILRHLRQVLEQGAHLDPEARQALAEQFEVATMSNEALVEWAWQTQLATHTSNLSDMRRSILKTAQSDLDDVVSRLLSAEHGWLCLANGPAPSWEKAEQWQTGANLNQPQRKE